VEAFGDLVFFATVEFAIEKKSRVREARCIVGIVDS
jgi:hypothetical protein